MLTQVGEAPIDELPRRRGDEHLAAVARRRDPRRPMDVRADVTLLALQRRARVHPHPHPDWAARERLGRLGRGRERAGRGGEGVEQGVPLRVNLDAAVRGKRLAQHSAMFRERVGVGLCAQLVEKLRRPFDVGKNEGDGP